VKVELFAPQGERILMTDRAPFARFVEELEGGLAECERERAGAMEHLMSFRAVSPEDRRRVSKLVELFSEPNLEVRDEAALELKRMGGVARVVLEKFETERRCPETQARIAEVLRSPRWWRVGLEREIPFLLGTSDPRARERLRRIVSNVRPFVHDGFPGLDAEAYLRGWWAYSRNRLVWDPEADRFRER